MPKIRIGGAGISGLTAAINLAKEGYEVDVYEANPFAGGRHFGDSQFLENWTASEDILDTLKSLNIKVAFPHKPIKEIQFYSPSLSEYLLKSKQPIMYGVRRGPGESIDSSLAKQAEELGANLHYNKYVSEKDVDIIATGPKKISAFASGITFETYLHDLTKVLFDNKLAPGSYSYFTVLSGEATLVSCSRPKSRGEHAQHIKSLLNYFRSSEKFSVRNKKDFSGFQYFDLSDTAIIDGRYYVGEAAGFQDYLAGFGMRYAFVSGYLAAKSILSGDNYDKLWKEGFLGPMKTSVANKFIFKQAGKFGYDWLIKLAHHRHVISALEGGDDGRTILHTEYAPTIRKKILFSFIRNSYKEGW